MAIAFVQKVNKTVSNNTTASVSVPGVGAGHVLIVVIGWANTTSTISSVSDGTNTYSVGVATKAGTGVSQAIYYVASAAAGSPTVTVTLSATVSGIDLTIYEFSGVGAVDKTASAFGTGTAASSGSVTTTVANELLFGAGTVSNAFSSGEAGWTSYITPFSDLMEYDIVSSTGSYAATGTAASGSNWVMQLITFQASGSGSASVTATDTDSFSDSATVTTADHVSATDTESFSDSAAATTVEHSSVTDTLSFSDSATPTVVPAANVPAFVKQVENSATASTMTLSLTGVVSGDLLVLYIAFADTITNIVSVSDGVNTYQVAAPLTRGTNLSQAIYYAPRVTGGNLTVTITLDASAKMDAVLAEFSNVDTFDTGSAGSGLGTTADSGAVITSHANELVFAAGTSSYVMLSGEAGWTATVTAQGNIVEYVVASSAGRYDATATQGSSNYYIMQVVTFYKSVAPLQVSDSFALAESAALVIANTPRTATDTLTLSDSATAGNAVATAFKASAVVDRIYPNFISPNGPAARPGGVGLAADFFSVVESVSVRVPVRVRLTSSTPGTSPDYVPYLYSRPVKKDRLNDLKYLDFSLVPSDGNFVKLLRGSYIKLQTSAMGTWFTGYITNDPDIERLGTEAGKEVFGYKYQATSDDYILNLKPIGILPPFLNMTQGDILKALVEILAPSHNFDVSNIQPGLSLARYVVDTSSGVGGATKYFSDIVKEFADQAAYTWWAKDNTLNFVQQDSVAPALVIDGSDSNFTSKNLKLTPSKDQIINDAIVVGDLEPQARMTEYFVGDGFTTKFPLISSVFGVDSTVYLDDTFSASEIDTTKWFVFDDPQNYLQVSNGYLNALGGRNDGSFGVYLQSAVQISLGGHLRITHGEYDFVTASDGVIGGLWPNPPDQVPMSLTTIYSVVGSGTDISGTSDQLNLLSESVNGDGVLTARVTSLTNNSETSRAGLMFRNSSAAGDIYAAVWVANGLIGFSYRTASAAQAKTVTIVSQGLPKWLRLSRVGNAFTASYSTDGVKWTQIVTPVGISGATNSMLAGMFVCAETALSGALATTTDTAEFDNVAFPSGGLTDADIGGPATPGSYSNVVPTTAAPLTGCLYGIKASKQSGSTILNPLVNGVVDQTQSLTINYNYRYVLRTIYAFPNPSAYAQNYAYMDQSGQIVQLGNASYTGGEAVFQTWIAALDPNTAKVIATYSWQNTTMSLPARGWASYCPLVLNDLHCSMTGVTISAPLQASLALQPSGSSAWTYQLIGPNEIDSFDGLAPIATIVDSNQGAVTRSSQLGRLQYNAGSPALEFFYDTTKQTQFVPQVGELIRLTYSRAAIAMARVQDKTSVQIESGAWGDNGLRSIIRRDFMPLPRTSVECELAASALVGDLGRQHWDGTYQGWNIYSFTGEPISGMILSFKNLPASFPTTLGVEVIQEVQTTFVAVSPQEIFEHKVQFGRKDGLKKTLALFTQKQDILPQQDTAEIPTAINISAVGQVFAEDVIAPTLTKWDINSLYYAINQNPPVNGGFEVRYTDDSWGADASKNLVTRTTGTTFTVPRTIRGRLVFVRAYDARNNVLYSEDFTNSVWGKDTGVVVNNSTLFNPDENLSLISRVAFPATTKAIWQTTATPSASTTSVFSISVKGTSGDSYTLKIVDSVSHTVINSVTFTTDGNWQRVSVSGTAPSNMTGNLEVSLTCNGPGLNLYVTRASLEVGTSAETIYCKTMSVPYGALSRFAAGIHSSLPMIPDAPTASIDYTDPKNPVITVTLPNVQDDVWGYQIQDSNLNIVHKQDLSEVLVGQAITYTIANNTATTLVYHVSCYNLLGEVGNSYNLKVVIPSPPQPSVTSGVVPLVGGFEFMFQQSGATTPTVDSYKVYRNTTNDPNSASVCKVIKHDPTNSAGEIVVQDMPGGDKTYYYWVSAADGMGQESAKAYAGGGTSLTQSQQFGRNYCPNNGFEINTLGTRDTPLAGILGPVCDGWQVITNGNNLFTVMNESSFGHLGSHDLLIRLSQFATVPNGTYDCVVQSTQRIPVQYGDFLNWKVWHNAAYNVVPPSQLSFMLFFGLMLYTASDALFGYYFSNVSPNFGSWIQTAKSVVQNNSITYVRPYVQLRVVNSGAALSTGSALYCDLRYDDLFYGITATSQDVVPQSVGYTPNSQPLSASNPSGTASISVAAFSVTYPFGVVNYNSGSIGGLLGSTKYYVVAYDPTYSGGAVSYSASRNNPSVTSNDGYIFLGSITTPASGGGGTSGTGGGGGPCFTPNTKMLGGKRIENVRAGDRVWVEKDDGTRVLRRVRKVLIHPYAGTMYRMQGDELVTPDHRFRSSGSWVPAKELFEQTCHYEGAVYNLMIDTDQEDERNYVLANGLCAHNVFK